MRPAEHLETQRVTKTLRCAVVGAGYLGKYHAEKYARLPACQLVAVVDVDRERALRVAEKFGARALSGYRDLLGDVDAVSVVVPTTLHYQVARDFLEADAHVLVEKPITACVAEADDLIRIAQVKQRVLQVGHLERFNPAILALDLTARPLFIESHRLAPFNPRATDVSVVLDLMIHDIDIILDLVGAEIERIDASGAPVLTPEIDIANARIVFKSGCVANVTASRVSMKIERKLRVFQPQTYVSLDLQNRVLRRYRRGAKEMYPGIPAIDAEEVVFQDGDPLMEEITHFVECIQRKRRPLVSGEAGRRALATALEISRLLRSPRPVA